MSRMVQSLTFSVRSMRSASSAKSFTKGNIPTFFPFGVLVSSTWADQPGSLTQKNPARVCTVSLSRVQCIGPASVQLTGKTRSLCRIHSGGALTTASYARK
jgi:hypothetical protein